MLIGGRTFKGESFALRHVFEPAGVAVRSRCGAIEAIPEYAARATDPARPACRICSQAGGQALPAAVPSPKAVVPAPTGSRPAGRAPAGQLKLF